MAEMILRDWDGGRMATPALTLPQISAKAANLRERFRATCAAVDEPAGWRECMTAWRRGSTWKRDMRLVDDLVWSEPAASIWQIAGWYREVPEIVLQVVEDALELYCALAERQARPMAAE